MERFKQGFFNTITDGDDGANRLAGVEALVALLSDGLAEAKAKKQHLHADYFADLEMYKEAFYILTT